MKQKFINFMKGRYGIDILGRDMMFIAMFILILSLFINNSLLRYGALLLYILMYFRMFSKNFTKRYNENRLYTNFKGKLTDPFAKMFKKIKDFPKYKYFTCKQCGQKLRVPRGKKKIEVTCPKCHNKFDART